MKFDEWESLNRDHKHNIFIVKRDIYCMKAEIERTQGHLKIAMNALEYHRKEMGLESLVYFCTNGKYPDQ